MLIYDNGRFTMGKVSFQLPNGVGIDTSSDELSGEGFCLYAPDKRCSILIDFVKSEKNAYQTICKNFDAALGYKPIEEIQTFSCGGLSGYKAYFEDDENYHEEYVLDLVDCEKANLLDIYILIDKDSYNQILKDKIVKEILDSIKTR